MRQSEIFENPILEIVSRIVSVKADLDDTALVDSVHLVMDEFDESFTDAFLNYSSTFFPCCEYTGRFDEIEDLHEQLQRELICLTNTFATTDISTMDVLEHLRKMTANFYLQVYSAYSLTDEEIDDGIEQYQIQIGITQKLIEALQIRKQHIKKRDRLEMKNASKEKCVYFEKVRLDIGKLKVLYRNLCKDMCISNTSEDTFLYVFGGHTTPTNRVIRWESTLAELVALLETVVRDYEIWRITSCCFETKRKDGTYSLANRDYLKTTKDRQKYSQKYTHSLEKMESFCQ